MPNDGIAWMIKARSRELTLAEQHALALWLSLSANRQQYLRAEVIWRLLGGLAEERLSVASSGLKSG